MKDFHAAGTRDFEISHFNDPPSIDKAFTDKRQDEVARRAKMVEVIKKTEAREREERP